MKPKNKINFITGENYTLAELFSGNYRVIIPDLQRDYCWGDEVHTEQKIELVSGFIGSLINQYEDNGKNEQLNLGLIYAYEMPQNHIQLCDGQQRLTTLFLLIGMLHKKTGAFRRQLISDYEYDLDDKEPYLHYAIRESSLYFLRDLVSYFFIDNQTVKVEDIKKTDWYFLDYDLDPSIQSMLKALVKIEKTLEGKDEEWAKSFGEWLIHRLTFMYLDMMDRKNGEETFVVINTTGEPLSATQNLKPLIINAEINSSQDKEVIAKEWEEIETWFWKHRSGDNDTAEAGFNEFLRWVTLLNVDKEEQKRILLKGTYTFPIDKIPFSEIYAYWEIVERLSKKEDFLCSEHLSPKEKAISQIDCFKLLPLIAYCKKWNIEDVEDRNLLRLTHFLRNLSKIPNVGSAINDLVGEAIKLAKSYRDLIEWVDNAENISVSNTILSDEEKKKLEILKDNLANREDFEEAFWEAQKHSIWSGEILPLIEWSKENGQFCLDKFKKYDALFNAIFKDDSEHKIVVVEDVVRRALLAKGLNGYPRIFRGNTNYSFAWNPSDWKILINDNDNKTKFQEFFDELLSGGIEEEKLLSGEIQEEELRENLEKMLQKMIDKGDFKSSPWADFVDKDYLLKYCEFKNIQYDGYGSWILVKKERATRWSQIHIQTRLLYEEKASDWGTRFPKWNICFFESGGCVVVENKSDDLVFDIFYDTNKGKPIWRFEFFKREHEKVNDLEGLVYDKYKWSFNGERYEYEITIPFESENYYSNYQYPNVLEFLEEMIKTIDKQIEKGKL